jgi:hypothetical protein
MPSKEGIDLAGKLLEQIKELDPDDVDFVLTVLNASFPKEKSSTSGKKEKSSSKKEETKPSKAGVAQDRQGRGGGGRGSSHAGRGGGHATGVDTATPAVEDLLPDVLRKLTPLTQVFPEISRDPSADVPKSDRKSVQKRLNGKRAELSKTFERFSGLDNDYYGFECLNKIQAFLLAAFDAGKTDGVRLRTDPLPADFPTYVKGLKAIAEERIASKEITDYGFFSNSDHKYDLPKEENTDDTG